MDVTHEGMSHLAMRQNNIAVVLRAIYEFAPIARVDLIARTGLNAATVSRLVNDLIDDGLVRQLGHRTSPGAGRRAIELEVSPTARYAVGVDVSAPAVTAVVTDLAGNIVARVRRPMPKPWSLEHLIATAAQVIKPLLTDVSADVRSKLVGVGIGAPGRFRITGGTHFGNIGILDPWTDLGSQSEVDRQVGLPVVLDGNANTSALAEMWFGKARGVSDFALLNLGEGIAMSVAVGGQIHLGSNHYAGHIAHFTVNADGPQCVCGNYGCLRQYVDRAAILEDVRELLATDLETTLADSPHLTSADVIAAYREGDPLAQKVLGCVAHYIASAPVAILNSYDPELILLGRDFAAAGGELVSDIASRVEARLMRTDSPVRIEATSVREAPLVGASALALRNFFRSPRLRSPHQFPET